MRELIIPFSIIAGFSVCSYLCNFSKYKETLIITNIYNQIYESVCIYLYDKHHDKINLYNYSQTTKIQYNYRKRDSITIQKYTPFTCSFSINYEGNILFITVDYKKDLLNRLQTFLVSDCGGNEKPLSVIKIQGGNKDIINKFVDNCIKYAEDKEKNRDKDTKTISIYYYKTDYWSMISKIPKRNIDTVYTKDNIKNDLLKSIKDFLSNEQLDKYTKYGIPYKYSVLLHGPPGTGKTSLIKSIASELNLPIFFIPISKDMVDTNFVDAFSNFPDSEKNRILVLEDIDTSFDERKEDDSKNYITLQSILNVLDGFTTIEGTVVFLTANKPEVFDTAMMRSCRIDKIQKIDYADESQTKAMFNSYLKEQEKDFDKFYNIVKNHDITTAMLQEIFFYNNDTNIINRKEEIKKIIEKNKKRYFEIIESKTNLYG